MTYVNFMIFILFLSTSSPTAPPFPRVSDNLRKKLETERQNALCCANGLDCCPQPRGRTIFEVKSLITNCPNTRCSNITSGQVVVHRDRPPPPERLTECTQKLLLTVKMTNEGVPSEGSQYVIVDHITDAATMKQVRVLNPYAVRIRQEPVLQVYELRFERAVNAEAREKVYTGHDRYYRGCKTDVENPTCGLVLHEGKVVPYSMGFCCSCKDDAEGQWPVPAGRKIRPDDYKHYGFTGGVNDQGTIRRRRGGQTCDAELDGLPNPESTHCLTFSHLWYSVYQLSKPRIVHRLRIQIYQKYEDCHGETHWMDLTQGKVIDIGTHQPSSCDKDIIARYTAQELDIKDQTLDHTSFKLLIPERRIVDPGQFMVLPKKMISDDGKCNTAGVGYEAFYKQEKRCSMPQGSCLQNQPQHFHDCDTQAEKEGRRGSYFLKYFGAFAPDPIGYNSTGQIQFLKFVYMKPRESTLYFELNADLVTLLKPNAFASITEIYTDATSPSRTRLIVKITNTGLLYGVFYIRLSSCPLDVPASFNNIASKSVLISPQHQHIFNLLIEYPLPLKDFTCSVHVHNINQELIAVRQVRFHRTDRCFCIWYCECVCYEADKGLTCTQMTLDMYHAAGFQGGYPNETHLIESSYLDDVLAMLFSMFLFLILTLLAMGLMKALIGLCWKEMGLWGLDTILGIEKPDVICYNKKCEYRNFGLSVAAQFCINVMFFLLYPLALFNVCIGRFCFPRYTSEDYCECENYEEDEERSEEGEKTSSDFSLKYTTSEDKSTESDLNDE